MAFVVVLAIGAREVTAAEPSDAERRAVAIANIALGDDPAYAERLYAEFVTAYPESALLGETLLGQALAMNKQGKFDAALTVLREQRARAGGLVDQFDYWIGENLMAKGDLAGAEAAFAGLIASQSGSSLIINAAVLQAYTHYQRKDFERTIALLAESTGAFERARAAAPASDLAVNGLLLLAESRFELKRFAEIEPTLALLPAENLPATAAWRRGALRARVLAGTNRAAEANALMPEVLQLAKSTERPELIAESHALNGAVLEQLSRPADALAAYEPNLKVEVAAKWRGQALTRVVALAQLAGGPAAAVQRLELLSAQGLDESARDLVQLTLGELRLRMFQALPPAESANVTQFSPAASNHLHGALVNFTNVIAGYTNSPYLGKAWLDRGWCHWYLTQWPGAVEAFDEASRRLPGELDQATAVFKLAESQFQAGQVEAALTNFTRLVRNYREIPAVQQGLLDQAYYQLIKAAIQTGNQAEAEFAVKALLEQFPGNFYAERGLLLVGQFLNDIREPAKSRTVLEEFANRFQESSLAPERELAIARTFELENKWPEAAGIYSSWITRYTNHASRASAEFHRAFALASAQDLTNAVTGFTNFVASFPQSELAPKAFIWLGNHYDLAHEFTQAELNYQQIFSGPHATNWPVSRLSYEARLYASRSAFERQSYGDARGYLTNLLNKPICPTNEVAGATSDCCPRDVYADALFAYGDVFAADSSVDVSRFGTARTAFQRLVSDYPESLVVPAAFGRIGECSIQLGAHEDATNAFVACMRHPLATVAERSRAEVGLGVALERKAESLPAAEQSALLDAARDHYLNVFYQRNIDLQKGEVPDPQWLQQSCESAVKLAVRRKDWTSAARLYERLRELLPVLKDYYEPLIRQMEERARVGG